LDDLYYFIAFISIKNNQFGSTFTIAFLLSSEKNCIILGFFKLIVEAHQGKIDVKSSVGKGTTFVLWFPLG
jgi:light-regulated signal transduction histidine kinase (bacteriophytochrome)